MVSFFTLQQFVFMNSGILERGRGRGKEKKGGRRRENGKGGGINIWGFMYTLIYVLLKLPAVFSV